MRSVSNDCQVCWLLDGIMVGSGDQESDLEILMCIYIQSTPGGPTSQQVESAQSPNLELPKRDGC